MSAGNSEPGPSKDSDSFFEKNVGAMDTKLTHAKNLSQVKNEETEIGAAEMDQYGRLNNFCTSCADAEYVSTKNL